jgi:hypothetical protein
MAHGFGDVTRLLGIEIAGLTFSNRAETAMDACRCRRRA